MLDHEIIFIDEGSNDLSLEKIKELSNNDSKVNFVSFSRNFGKEAAIYAGLENSTGDYVVLMDADLQDPPSLLPEMLGYVLYDDYDSVATKRVSRKGEAKIRSFCANQFYKIINKISKTNIVNGARDYRLMSRQMVNSILELSEYNRFSKGIFSWVGYKTKWLEYDNIERKDGKSSWSFWQLFKYSLEGIIAFSTSLLAISTLSGLLFSLISFIMIVVIVFRTLIYGDSVPGWPSIICIILLVGGIQLFSIGILGEYLSKTYLETKKRPIYIVSESNFD
ncbi:putative glycosyltransferase CsbB [Methanobrevibacter cuticularis]|uniref:Putative glycosyltransferase CsbB n=2 Tax=Methanobrevibacter cuticularis TaxID=47311 RepID=A0A166DMZ2_9EURY|nr:putative glycosyltransferase CsbB [Methanobrevibacter cuticularis]